MVASEGFAIIFFLLCWVCVCELGVLADKLSVDSM